jgi:SOS-response transcriptional repressor LexA
MNTSAQMKAHQRYKRVLDFIKAYTASNNVAPTIAEIGQYVGLKSTASVFEVLIALENMGLIQRTRKWRGIEVIK